MSTTEPKIKPIINQSLVRAKPTQARCARLHKSFLFQLIAANLATYLIFLAILFTAASFLAYGLQLIIG